MRKRCGISGDSSQKRCGGGQGSGALSSDWEVECESVLASVVTALRSLASCDKGSVSMAGPCFGLAAYSLRASHTSLPVCFIFSDGAT